jgi:hypothetical protein
MKHLILILLFSLTISAQTFDQRDHDHLSRSRTKRFDFMFLRPPVKVTVYNHTEVSVVYESDGVLYNEVYYIDKNTKGADKLTKSDLCPDIRKECKEFWLVICESKYHEKRYLYVITPVLDTQKK